MAPRNTVSWRRPYTSIYNDNYKYGTNLYSDTLSECRKKNKPESSLSFVSSSVVQSPTPAPEKEKLTSLPPTSPVIDVLPSSSYHGSMFQNLMDSAFYSSYAKDVDTDLDLQTTKKKTTTTTSTVTATSGLERQPSTKRVTTPTETSRPQSLCLYDDANLFLTNPKVIPPASVRLTDDDSKKKRKKVVTETTTTKISSSAAPTSNITTTTTTVNVPSQNGPNASVYWKDQCRELQSQVDLLTQALGDVNNKLKGELSTIKGKLHNDITDMNMSMEQSSLQSNELQKTVKRQSNQLLELQSAYDDLQRHLQDSLDEVAGYQKKSATLRKEMDRLRSGVEETLQKSPNAVRV